MNSRLLTMRTLLLLAVLALIGLGADSASADSHGDAWLGVALQEFDADLAEAMDIDPDAEGALVAGVEDDSPAEKAGIDEGDLIVAFAGKSVDDASSLIRHVRRAEPGDEVEIEILRDGKRKTLKATLAEREERVVFLGDLHDKVLDLDKLDQFHWQGDDGEHEIVIQKYLGGGAFLGVKLQDLGDQLAAYFEVEGGGALVASVVEDSPAEAAGLEAGDVIVKMDDADIDDADDVHRFVRKHEEGDEVALEVVRKGDRRSLKATLAERDEKQAFRMRGGDLPHVRMAKPWKHRERIREFAPPAPRGGEMQRMQKELQELREELKELREELRD